MRRGRARRALQEDGGKRESERERERERLRERAGKFIAAELEVRQDCNAVLERDIPGFYRKSLRTFVSQHGVSVLYGVPQCLRVRWPPAPVVVT